MLGTVQLVLVALAVGAVTLYLFRGALFGSQARREELVSDAGFDDNNFVERLTTQNKRLAVFFGSQTGTAEEYAVKIAREAKSRYGTSALVLDPDTQEMDKLDQVPENCVVVFVMATYGEGEPTDNAVGMMEFLQSQDVSFSEGLSLIHI